VAVFSSSFEHFQMSLTRTQVEGIAHLARLEITEAQMPVYVDSLSRIIDFVEQLSAAETAGVEPMAHPLADQVQRLRPDVVAETDQREKFQRNAASVAAGLYLVPKVIE
jgi:aspartyl-tRNA(Asn)/glutamyl-tRNA(Gln) amidotransferase subunit C